MMLAGMMRPRRMQEPGAQLEDRQDDFRLELKLKNLLEQNELEWNVRQRKKVSVSFEPLDELRSLLWQQRPLELKVDEGLM
jgi:hypothetical protein